MDIEPEWATEAALEPYRRLSLTPENDLRATGWTLRHPTFADGMEKSVLEALSREGAQTDSR